MKLLYYIFGMFMLATGIYATTVIDSDAPKKEKIVVWAIVIIELIICICLLLNLGS